MTGYRIELAVPGRNIREQQHFARLAESHGLTGGWLSEVNGGDAVTQAAAVGMATTSARVGTAIIPIQTRDPLLMVMTAHSLADLTGGRFVLGLGTSTKVIVEDWHGRPWGKPLSGVRAYVELLRKLMAGERVSAQGPYPMKRASLAVRSPNAVPIHLAALNDGMLRLAGEAADGAILNFVSTRQVRRSVEIMHAARKAAGIDTPFEVSVFFRCTVTDDPAAALPRYQQELLTYLLAPVYQAFFARDGYADLVEVTNERWSDGQREAALNGVPMEFIAERALIGTAESIHARLEAYGEAGMNNAIVLPVPIPGTDYGEACTTIIEALAPSRR